MKPLKIMATIDDALFEVEVRPLDQQHLNYEVIQDGKQIGVIYKANDNWYAKEDTCLMQDDIIAIGKAVDKQLEV